MQPQETFPPVAEATDRVCAGDPGAAFVGAVPTYSVPDTETETFNPEMRQRLFTLIKDLKRYHGRPGDKAKGVGVGCRTPLPGTPQSSLRAKSYPIKHKRPFCCKSTR